jgi:hypothetical protein
VLSWHDRLLEEGVPCCWRWNESETATSSPPFRELWVFEFVEVPSSTSSSSSSSPSTSASSTATSATTSRRLAFAKLAEGKDLTLLEENIFKVNNDSNTTRSPNDKGEDNDANPNFISLPHEDILQLLFQSFYNALEKRLDTAGFRRVSDFFIKKPSSLSTKNQSIFFDGNDELLGFSLAFFVLGTGELGFNVVVEHKSIRKMQSGLTFSKQDFNPNAFQVDNNNRKSISLLRKIWEKVELRIGEDGSTSQLIHQAFSSTYPTFPIGASSTPLNPAQQLSLRTSRDDPSLVSPSGRVGKRTNLTGSSEAMTPIKQEDPKKRRKGAEQTNIPAPLDVESLDTVGRNNSPGLGGTEDDDMYGNIDDAFSDWLDAMPTPTKPPPLTAAVSSSSTPSGVSYHPHSGADELKEKLSSLPSDLLQELELPAGAQLSSSGFGGGLGSSMGLLQGASDNDVFNPQSDQGFISMDNSWNIVSTPGSQPPPSTLGTQNGLGNLNTPPPLLGFALEPAAELGNGNGAGRPTPPPRTKLLKACPHAVFMTPPNYQPVEVSPALQPLAVTYTPLSSQTKKHNIDSSGDAVALKAYTSTRFIQTAALCTTIFGRRRRPLLEGLIEDSDSDDENYNEFEGKKVSFASETKGERQVVMRGGPGTQSVGFTKDNYNHYTAGDLEAFFKQASTPKNEDVAFSFYFRHRPFIDLLQQQGISIYDTTSDLYSDQGVLSSVAFEHSFNSRLFFAQQRGVEDAFYRRFPLLGLTEEPDFDSIDSTVDPFASPASTDSIIRLISAFKPIAQEVFGPNLKGALTLEQWASIGSEDFSAITNSSSSFSASATPSSSLSSALLTNPPSVFPFLLLQTPRLRAGFVRDGSWLKTSPYAVQFWEKAFLEPQLTRKPVTYYVLCPRNDQLASMALTFFRELSCMYEVGLTVYSIHPFYLL